MDVFEKKGNLVTRADLPGMKKEDVEVAIEEGDLILRGERKEETEVEEENVYRWERSYASSIVAPSHEIGPEARKMMEGELSPMGDFSDAMSVRQLIDLVAYLDSLEAR